jgi:arylsulfatase A-like enzyme/Flp pilus assembly protein TadD
MRLPQILFFSAVLCGSALLAAPLASPVETRPAASSQTGQAPSLPAGRQSKPDVFLITIDTLRADHVHCYGDKDIQTPTLDGLAKDGVRFSEAFTPSPITNTSHTTILTGLLPSSHGVTDFAIPLSPEFPTWAELLKGDGYHTAAFIGAVILDAKTLAPGLDRGFDYYDYFPAHPQTKERWGRVERRGMVVVEHAERWLNENRAGPHFVWVHLYDPHDPYEPPAPFSVTYKDRLYDGEIAYADSALGHFIGYLKKQGWYENSLIIVVGDHGEGLGEHHEDTHGIFLYDSTTHVPLILKLPGHAEAAKVVSAQVRTTDILPTVLDTLGIAPPAKKDGESLKPYYAADETGDRTAFGQTDYPLRFGWAPLRSVRDGGFKFIEAPRPELYDLHSDPGELHNNYEPQSAEVQRLSKMLAPFAPKAAGDSSPLPAIDPKDKIEEQNLLHAALLASEDNRPDDARTALEAVVKRDPKSPVALLQLGQLELAAKNYAKAAEYLRGATELRPDDSAAALNYGQALEKLGDLPRARDALQATLKLNPGQFDARLLLGKVFLGLKDFSSAADQLEAALLVQADNVDAQLALAEAQIGQRNFDDAVQQLQEVTRAQPKNSRAFELLAEAYAGLGKNSQATQAKNRAVALRQGAKSQ